MERKIFWHTEEKSISQPRPRIFSYFHWETHTVSNWNLLFIRKWWYNREQIFHFILSTHFYLNYVKIMFVRFDRRICHVYHRSSQFISFDFSWTPATRINITGKESLVNLSTTRYSNVIMKFVHRKKRRIEEVYIAVLFSLGSNLSIDYDP